MGPGEDTLGRLRLPYEPEPLATARADSAVESLARRVHDFLSRAAPGASLGDLERRIGEALYRPAHLPAVGDLVLGEDGTVWLRRFDPRDGRDVWWVVDAEGRLAREVSAPAGLALQWIDGERVWGVDTDELDVSYLVRYRLVPEDRVGG